MAMSRAYDSSNLDGDATETSIGRLMFRFNSEFKIVGFCEGRIRYKHLLDHRNPPFKFTCSICVEEHTLAAMVDLECEHKYCVDCTKEFFVRAAHDETLFPPRCCKQPIDPEFVTKHLSAQERKAFEDARIEFSTINRVYCSNVECGKFLPPSLVHARTNVATCPVCDARTCASCKNESHVGFECPDDPEVLRTRRLAWVRGWKVCPGCNAIVEKRDGCNRMNCRCGAVFCYQCGVLSNACNCGLLWEARNRVRGEFVIPGWIEELNMRMGFLFPVMAVWFMFFGMFFLIASGQLLECLFARLREGKSPFPLAGLYREAFP